jgi:hypothetical protein
MNNGQIKQFLHCRRCLEERTIPNVEAGFTDRGLQIRCRTHDANMMHVDFEGVTHPADLTADGNFGEVSNAVH